jgi:hypothetical protein
MSLKERLERELLSAMKSKNDVRKRTIRMAISNIKLAEVEKRDKLDDTSIMALIHKEIKTRHETIEDARKGNRENIVKEAEAEIAVLLEFLPKPLSENELIDLTKSVINELNATSMKEMGAVMKEMVQRVEGRASTDQISRVVRDLLQG